LTTSGYSMLVSGCMKVVSLLGNNNLHLPGL